MKKVIALLSVCIMLTGTACTGKKDPEQNLQSSDTVTTVQGETEQPDPLSPDKTTISDAGKKTTASVTTTSVSTTAKDAKTEAATTAQPDPLGGGAFSYDDNGAIVFEDPEEKQDDTVMISAAQRLFDSACQTYWKFLINCPYDLDYGDYVENDFKWQFYKIKNSDIHSMADVERDFNKVFSSRYPNELSTNYRESNGAVYALNGERGAHLYYSASKITGIDSRTDDEIFFTVENYYDGSDFSDEAYSETDTFSMVLEDGIWKVGKFTLPY